MASLRPMIRSAARWRVAAAAAAPLRRRFATASDARSSGEAATATQQHAHPGNRVRVVEVGPRDGLQNESKSIPLATKIELIERLAKTGVSSIEAGSFVSPKWVPQMENSGDILEHILTKKIDSRVPLTYSFLAPNAKGFENANALLQKHSGAYLTEAEAFAGKTDRPGVELAVFAAATESFSRRNLNCDIETSLARFKDVIQGAKKLGIRARAYISVVLGCPFEGHEVNPHRVAEIATSLLEMGADEISLGDTTGMGTGPRTLELLRCMTAAGILSEDIAMHFHDTYGQALVNTVVALEHGIRVFDSAVGGLGGCPYSPGATGNVATENMVYFLESLGMDTGVDLDAMVDVGQWITQELGKPNDSAVGKAVLGARKRAAETPEA
ncbi:hydroxymethylglutaryl-CoA lyase [Durotheca rogersii]|uniref:hydroxymethylglutaryl-CoA lyase n=1 Tax=Durotheca rogersii TaxID=419775 RepID=UPI002220855A|nr:hydroxymethylglutaryl-CoA lyase [Durotheca rogersii]KAI5862432.1 hydroxymethylglutaryl-CoA lyase [Durotheca rogersii]